MTNMLGVVLAWASMFTTISGVASVNLTSGSATIVWTTNVSADSRVEYGLTLSYGSQTVLNSTAVTSHTQSLTGLSASTLYHFRVHSRDAGGILATSGDFTFTTRAAPDLVAPLTPAGLMASAVSSSQINLSWAASGDNVGVTGYTIRRNGVVVASTAATGFQNSGLAPNTRYTYAVRAGDAAGNLSAWSLDFSVTTPNTSDITPPAISAVSSGNLTPAGATIVWATSEPADSRVEYGPTISYGSQTTLNTAAVTSHSQGLTGLAANTLYHFRVRSSDAAGNPATSGDFVFTTPAAPDLVAPLTPAGLTARALSSSQISLSWAASGDNVGVTDYAIRRNGVVVAHTAATSFTNGGLAPRTRYTYAVRAMDAAGNLSAWSSEFSLTTP
jgi:chitodextrinase